MLAMPESVHKQDVQRGLSRLQIPCRRALARGVGLEVATIYEQQRVHARLQLLGQLQRADLDRPESQRSDLTEERVATTGLPRTATREKPMSAQSAKRSTMRSRNSELPRGSRVMRWRFPPAPAV